MSYVKNGCLMTAKLTTRTKLMFLNILHHPRLQLSVPKRKKRQCVELGFVEKLIEFWRLRTRIMEDKTEILVSGILARYTYKAGGAIVNKTLTYRSSYMAKVFRAKKRTYTVEEEQSITGNAQQLYCAIQSIIASV